MGKWKERLAIHWNERFRFECREAWDVLWEARRAFWLDGCLNLSAALAFYTILALIPIIFLLSSGWAYILGSSESGLRMTLSSLGQLFPHASSLILEEAGAISQRAGVIGLESFLSMLWTASVIFSSLEVSMIVPISDAIIVTKSRNPRAADPMALKELITSIDIDKTVFVEDSIPRAIDHAKRIAKQNN